jgi:hypothetical protein
VNIVSINLHLSTSADRLRDEIHSLMVARKSPIITVEDKNNMDAVIDILDDLLEKCISAESRRGETMNELELQDYRLRMEKCAEMLVESGYAVNTKFVPIEKSPDKIARWVLITKTGIHRVELFLDTLEGRRQADAIENWLVKLNKEETNWNGLTLWGASRVKTNNRPLKMHQWRLDRIKWCVQELIK